MAQFDQQTLRKLHDLKEVTIRTTKHPASAVTIWVVVSDADVFVRSVHGTKGRWYKDLANGGPATLEFNGEQLAVQAAPATDAVSTERASQEFLSKYRTSPYATSNVRARRGKASCDARGHAQTRGQARFIRPNASSPGRAVTN